MNNEDALSSKEMRVNRNDRWMHLYLIAERLGELSIHSGSHQEAMLLLDSLIEVFPKELDPVTDFEAFSTRQFVKALQSFLRTRGRDTEAGNR